MKKSCRARRRTRCKTSRRTRCKTSRRTRCKTSRSTQCRSKNIKKLGKSRKLKKKKVFFGGIFLPEEFVKLPVLITQERYEILQKDEKLKPYVQKIYEKGTYYKNENNDYDYISTEKYNTLENPQDQKMYNEHSPVIFYKKKKTNEPYDTRTQAVNDALQKEKELEKRRAIIGREEGAVEMNFEDTTLGDQQQQYNDENGTNIQYRKPLIDNYNSNYNSNYDVAYLQANDAEEKEYWKNRIMTALFGTSPDEWDLKYLPVFVVPKEVPSLTNQKYKLYKLIPTKNPSHGMVQTGYFNVVPSNVVPSAQASADPYNVSNQEKIYKYRKPIIDSYESNWDEAYLDAVHNTELTKEKSLEGREYWKKEIMTLLFGTNEDKWDLHYLPKSIVPQKFIVDQKYNPIRTKKPSKGMVQTFDYDVDPYAEAPIAQASADLNDVPEENRIYKYRNAVMNEYNNFNYDEKYLDAVRKSKYDILIFTKVFIMDALFGRNEGDWDLKYLPKSIV